VERYNKSASAMWFRSFHSCQLVVNMPLVRWSSVAVLALVLVVALAARPHKHNPHSSSSSIHINNNINDLDYKTIVSYILSNATANTDGFNRLAYMCGTCHLVPTPCV
jgi:hypothetical protein